MKKLYSIRALAAIFILLPSAASAQYYAQSPQYGIRYNTAGQAAYYLLPSDFSASYYSSSYYPGNAPAQALSVSCTAIPATAHVSEEVLWYSSVTGGAGNYTYSWSGADGLFGTQSTVRKAYATAGDKYAMVTVSSGGQSVIAGCSQIVKIAPTVSASLGAAAGTAVAPRLGASCFAATERIAAGESATWFAIVSGAFPSTTTTYQWDGTDGLTGDGPAAFKTYAKNGLKHALLTVTSGVERVMSVCTNAVAVVPAVPAVSTLAQAAKPAATAASAAKSAATTTSETSKISEAVARTSAATALDSKTTSAGSENAASSATGDGVEIVPQKEKRNLAAALISGFGNPVVLVLLALLAVLVGIFLATRRNRKEER